jgi:hypothetical protein
MITKRLALIGLFLAARASAATINFYDGVGAFDPNAGGIGYEWYVTLGGADSAVTPDLAGSHIGAWSWEDQGLFAPGDPTRGWTHTSQWVAVTLATSSRFTITLERNANIPNGAGFRPTDHLFPSFTLWAGWDNDDIPQAIAEAYGLEAADGENHDYNNRGNIDWAEDLGFIGLVDNNSSESATYTVDLAAGNYTIVLGSNSPSTSNPPRQGFRATFATTAVPEPSSALLAILATGFLGLRRRR